MKALTFPDDHFVLGYRTRGGDIWLERQCTDPGSASFFFRQIVSDDLYIGAFVDLVSPEGGGTKRLWYFSEEGGE